jgi:hypothetical protein
MIRTQIQLTEQQAEVLKATAARQGVSMAEVIRQSIDHLIETAGTPSQKELRQRAAAAAGRFRSSRGDVSVHHDDYLADAIRK